MLPLQKDIEIPLLEVLVDLGGNGKPKDVYPLVTKKFPEIRDEDLIEMLPSGGNKWTNRIQWVRQRLVLNGDIDPTDYGIWRITEKGRKRLIKETDKDNINEEIPKTFFELYEDYESSFRNQLLDRLKNISPLEFEQFAQRLLKIYGFVEVKVTQHSRDGGIDGYGKLKLGLALMNVAFQCKKWSQGNVGRPDVDKFRGAIQGEYEQGIFFTTSDFTLDAREVSLKKGAVPIILLNGESIINLMIEKEFGVKKVPLYAYYETLNDFTETDD